MSNRMVGPPNPAVYAPRPLEGRQDEPHVTSLSELWPLWIAQLADIGSTAALTKRGGRENNPLPGMQSNAGRVGWGLAELALLHALARRGVTGKAAANLAAAIHGTLAGQNSALANDPDRDDRLSTWHGINY